MNIWIRRTFFIISIIIFLIAATLLIFYASGWRYSALNNSLSRVGALSVNSLPSRATAFMNGKILKKQTPLSENNLVADEYNLLIYKDGYYDWEQRISIQQAKTTFIPDVYLIKQQLLDKLYLEDHIDNYKISNNKKFIAYYSKNKFVVHDLENNKKIFEELNANPAINFYWNNQDTAVIFENTEDFYLVNLSDNKSVPLDKTFDLKLNRIFWSKDEANIIYGIFGNELFRINKFQNTKELVLINDGVFYKYGDVYFIINDNSLTARNTQNEILDQVQLNSSYELKIPLSIGDYLPIIDIKNEKGFYFNLKNQNFEKILNDVNLIDGSNLNNLLLSNSHEIWNINNKDGVNNLILRTAENINKAYWLIDSQYVIYTTDKNQIKILEINRPENNSYEIDHQFITSLERAHNNNIFYLINNSGIYKLEF